MGEYTIGYISIYLLLNVFRTYTKYKFMRIFFVQRRTSIKVEALTYLVFYLVTSVLYLYTSIPMLMLIINILGILGLTFNYKSAKKMKLMATFLIYTISMLVDIAIALLFGYINSPIFSANKYSSIWGQVVVAITTYVVVLLIGNFKNIRKGIAIPNQYWLIIFFVPVGSLFIVLTLLQSATVQLYEFVVCFIIVLIINIIVFGLYDSISLAFQEKMEKILLEKQNQHYSRQFEVMQISAERDRTIRHDFGNHISILRMFAQVGEYELVLSYLQDLEGAITPPSDLANTGNVEIDSILNFKLKTAEDRGIDIKLTLQAPTTLPIHAFDLVVVLGNLLDNAITAASRAPGQKYLAITITYLDDTLRMQVENTFDGQLNYDQDKIQTTYPDKENHGMGLTSAGTTVAKYGGKLTIKHTASIFTVDVSMPAQPQGLPLRRRLTSGNKTSPEGINLS